MDNNVNNARFPKLKNLGEIFKGQIDWLSIMSNSIMSLGLINFDWFDNRKIRFLFPGLRHYYIDFHFRTLALLIILNLERSFVRGFVLLASLRSKRVPAERSSVNQTYLQNRFSKISNHLKIIGQTESIGIFRLKDKFSFRNF